VAEGERFELSELLHSPVFKTGAFGHSATPPTQREIYAIVLPLLSTEALKYALICSYQKFISWITNFDGKN
jgi:hypothetical protein